MLYPGSKVIAGSLAVLIMAIGVAAYEVDDTVPEAAERVARISYIDGEVKIRRDGNEDWEKAELNLPIVEGDEIVTESGSRLEIQFNKDTHLRLAQKSYLQIKQLTDAGVAAALSRGRLSLTLRKFDTEKQFFEIDAPDSTFAIQKSGIYRVDAGSPGDGEVRVGVGNDGEARVYSASSGFTIRSGRSATIFLDGDRAGEWEMSGLLAVEDDLDRWAVERDQQIDKMLAGAFYDRYYDADIYGAEDLNGYGDWEYTSDYGYVWRPYQSTIAGYRDWTPYRYGSWRWVPPFGWTWVNYEPWGWATYHHGRWIWHRNRWVWTPYGYYRSNRSWWYPALVVVRIIDRSICWYPIGYRDRHYNYNSGYHDWVGNRRRDDRDDRGRWDRGDRRRPGGSSGTPPRATPPASGKPYPGPIGKVVPLPGDLPDGSIVTLPKDDFGTGRKIGGRATPEIVKGVLRRIDADTNEEKLPTFESIKPRLEKGTITVATPTLRSVAGRKIGAAERSPGSPLDTKLRDDRFYGNRRPLPESPPVKEDDRPGGPIRGTGAVRRQPVNEVPGAAEPKRPENPAPIRTIPRTVAPRKEDRAPESKTTEQRSEQPVYTPPIRRERPRPEPPPERKEQPVEREKPRYDPPPRREDPAPRKDPPQERPTPPPTKRPEGKETPPPRPTTPIRRVKDNIQ